MLLVPGHNRGNMGTVSLHIRKLYLSYILTVFQLKTTWRLGNIQLVLIVAVVEVFLQEDLIHF